MKDGQGFDYVIVGAGSAGCVLANRISNNPRVRVALVEAGGADRKQEIHIPAAFSKLFKGPCDWAYFTEEQPHLNHRRLYWPRGKVLGGSSSINAMIYTRCSPADFDEWQRLGNEGWDAGAVEPYFDRALLDVCELRTRNPISEAFVEACREAGMPRNDGFNGAEREGAGFFHVTQRNGKRCSTALAYLKPVLGRKNLTVFTNALTTRVRIENGRAVGIDCVRDGQRMSIRAEREVILSGGAINSPQLLMVSGIGSADDLRKHGITVIADVPGVGANLQDHLFAAAVHRSMQPVSLAGAETIGNLLQYLVMKKGMLTSNVAEAGAFVRMRSDAAAPDVELIFGPTFYMSHGYQNPPGHGFTAGAILLHPKSRGAITLRSADPTDAPAIQPNYLAEADDLVLLREGFELALRVSNAKALARFRGEQVWPGPRAHDIDGFIRDTAETIYHPAGTCRMGSDDSAVVDERLRVRGVDALRVVDASVMPTLVSGHPNAVVVMLAERAAEMM